MYSDKALKATSHVERETLTKAERKLWAYLSDGKAGQTFELKYPMMGAGYIIDFFCKQLKLCVQIQTIGITHKSVFEKLAESKGLTVLWLNEDALLSNAFGTLRFGFRQKNIEFDEAGLKEKFNAGKLRKPILAALKAAKETTLSDLIKSQQMDQKRDGGGYWDFNKPVKKDKKNVKR